MPRPTARVLRSPTPPPPRQPSFEHRRALALAVSEASRRAALFSSFTMCGRYSLTAAGDLVAECFQLVDRLELPPRYNIAPTQEAPVIRRDRAGRRRLHQLRWGLVPAWARDLREGARRINARSETAAEKVSFRDAFRRHRCLIPADGFYEWQKSAGGRLPILFQHRGAMPFAMAGLWSRWRPSGEPPIDSFTILTTRANSLVEPIHDRMPVILPSDRHEVWLDPGVRDVELLESLLLPIAAEQMTLRPVSSFLNKATNEGPECWEGPGSGGATADSPTT